MARLDDVASRAAPDAIATRRRRERDVTRALVAPHRMTRASSDATTRERATTTSLEDVVPARVFADCVLPWLDARTIARFSRCGRYGDAATDDDAHYARRIARTFRGAVARHPGRADGTTSRRRTMRGVYLKMCALATAAAARADDARTGRRARGRRESGSARGRSFRALGDDARAYEYALKIMCLMRTRERESPLALPEWERALNVDVPRLRHHEFYSDRANCGREREDFKGLFEALTLPPLAWALTDCDYRDDLRRRDRGSDYSETEGIAHSSDSEGIAHSAVGARLLDDFDTGFDERARPIIPLLIREMLVKDPGLRRLWKNGTQTRETEVWFKGLLPAFCEYLSAGATHAEETQMSLKKMDETVIGRVKSLKIGGGSPAPSWTLARTAMWASNSYGMAHEVCHVIPLLSAMFSSDGFHLCPPTRIGCGPYPHGGRPTGDLERRALVSDAPTTANAMDGNYRGFRYAFDIPLLYSSRLRPTFPRHDPNDAVVFKLKLLIPPDYQPLVLTRDRAYRGGWHTIVRATDDDDVDVRPSRTITAYLEDGLGKAELEGVVYVVDDSDARDGSVPVCPPRVVLRGRYAGNPWPGSRLAFCGSISPTAVSGFVSKDFGPPSEAFTMWAA